MWSGPGRRLRNPLSLPHGLGHPGPAPAHSHLNPPIPPSDLSERAPPPPPPPPVCSRHGPRRPPGMAAVAGLRLPQLQLRDGRLPLLARHLIRRLRRRRLRRPHPPLPMPPPARARPPPGPRDQARRLGTLHAPHAHVLIQGRRHHAALGAAARMGHGDPHHRRRVLRLLPRTTGGALTTIHHTHMVINPPIYRPYIHSMPLHLPINPIH
jgi:hypothetical protein